MSVSGLFSLYLHDSPSDWDNSKHNTALRKRQCMQMIPMVDSSVLRE